MKCAALVLVTLAAAMRSLRIRLSTPDGRYVAEPETDGISSS